MSLRDRFDSREKSNKNSTSHLEEILINNKDDIEYVIRNKIVKKQFVEDIMNEFNGNIENDKIKFNTNNIFKLLDKCNIKNKWNKKRITKKDKPN